MPDHWQENTLAGLASQTIGGVWGADPGEDEIDVPVYRQTEFDDYGRLRQPAGAVRAVTRRQLASRTLVEGDVLIQKSAGTPTLPGRVVIVSSLPETSTFSNFLSLIRADKRVVEPRFLFFLLQHLHASGVAFAFQRGTNIRNLDLKLYLATRVTVPPISEQRRIVDVVGSIDSYISALEDQLGATRAARAALLYDLLSHPGDDWQETTLGDAADIVSGGTPRTAEPEFWNGDIVWVTPTEVVAHEGKVITDSERKITPEGLSGSSAKLLPVDAVLLTSRATIGAVALAGVPLATNQGFASLLCGGGLLPHFAMYWCQLNTHEFLSRAGGNTFREISRKKVAAIPMDLPPLPEQRRIVDVVGSFDVQVEALVAQLGAARRLRSGVLSELLSGVVLLDESYDVVVGS